MKTFYKLAFGGLSLVGISFYLSLKLLIIPSDSPKILILNEKVEFHNHIVHNKIPSAYVTLYEDLVSIKIPSKEFSLQCDTNFFKGNILLYLKPITPHRKIDPISSAQAPFEYEQMKLSDVSQSVKYTRGNQTVYKFQDLDLQKAWLRCSNVGNNRKPEGYCTLNNYFKDELSLTFSYPNKFQTCFRSIHSFVVSEVYKQAVNHKS